MDIKKKFMKTAYTLIFLLLVLTLISSKSNAQSEIYIDIGTPAIDRSGVSATGYTYIIQENPANSSGIITSIEMYAYTDMVDVEIATFYNIEGNIFSTRDTENIGTVVSGSKQTFDDLNLSVQEGDYIGFYTVLGSLEMTHVTGSFIIWMKIGDYIPCNSFMFDNSLQGNILSLYGFGIIPEEEPEPEPEITGFATVDLEKTSNMIFLFILVFCYLGVMALGFAFKNGGFVSFGFFIGIVLGFMFSVFSIFLTLVFLFMNIIIFWTFVKKN